jgi:hypothetical protein
MSNGAAGVLPMPTLDDDAWDDLLSFIDVRRWRERIDQAQRGQG